MAAEMKAVLEGERAALAALDVRFRQAPDARAALAVQREIERLKMSTELELLRIQAVFARRSGRLQAAQEIEAAIVELTRPVANRAVSNKPPDGSPNRAFQR